MRSLADHEDGQGPEPHTRGSEHRGGLLRGAELLVAGADHGSPPVRAEVLLALIVSLIEETRSGDALAIALYRTRSLSGATEEEMEFLVEAIRKVRSGVPRPRGMYPEF